MGHYVWALFDEGFQDLIPRTRRHDVPVIADAVCVVDIITAKESVFDSLAADDDQTVCS
jgi:hypothetical protein